MSYRLNVPWFERGFRIVIPGILVAFGLVDLIRTPEPSARIFMVGFIAFGVYFLLSELGTPYVITWPEGRSGIEFRSIIRTIVMPAGDILSIKPARFGGGTLEVRSRDRRCVIHNQFDGMHEFLTRLKAVNPSVELRGC